MNNNEKDRLSKSPSYNLRKKLTLEEKIKKKNDKETRKLVVKEKKRFDSFFEICLTTILAYFSKYFINIILTNRMINYKEQLIKENNFNNSINIEEFIQYSNSSSINPVLYESILKDLYDNDKNLYLIMTASYGISLLVSWILYKIFVMNLEQKKTQKNKEGDSHRIFELFGYIIYSEKKSLIKEEEKISVDNNKNTELVDLNDGNNASKEEKKGKDNGVGTKRKCVCLRLLTETCINCFNRALCSSFISCIIFHGLILMKMI